MGSPSPKFRLATLEFESHHAAVWVQPAWDQPRSVELLAHKLPGFYIKKVKVLSKAGGIVTADAQSTLRKSPPASYVPERLPGLELARRPHYCQVSGPCLASSHIP